MMSAIRFQQLWSGTNGAARKVYDSVPAQEDWSATRIAGDLAKRRDINMAFVTVQGCLEGLRASGLIRQSKNGFRREQVRAGAPTRTVAPVDMTTILPAEQPEAPPQETQPEPPAKKEAPMTAPVPPSPPSPPHVVDSISALAQKLAAMAARHAQEMQDLANEISDAAIDVQTEFERTDADFARMRQLQTLLKDFAR